MANQRALEFIAKAEKWLRWAQTQLREMDEYAEEAKLDDLERTFISLLSFLVTVHEALSAAAKCAGLKDWEDSLDRLRNTDPVLLYVWKARDSETHNALVKWTPATMASVYLRIVDPQAAHQTGAQFYADRSDGAVTARLLKYIYEAQTVLEVEDKMRSRFKPSEQRMKEAGVQVIIRDSFTLKPFWVTDRKQRLHVKPPTKHLGKQNVPPGAYHLAETALHFYHRKYQELTGLLGLPDALGRLSPLALRR